MNEKQKFEELKMMQKNHVLLSGTKHILISAPHAVEQIRYGKIKYAEPETALIALRLNQKGYPCVIKTKNENDDANFDDKSNYRDNLIDYCKKHDIKFVLDLHQLSPEREMDFCIGTGGTGDKNLLQHTEIKQIIKSNFEKENFIVKVNYPYDADFPPTAVARVCANNFIPAVLFEINCRVVSDFCGGTQLDKVIKIIEKLLKKIEKELKINEDTSCN